MRKFIFFITSVLLIFSFNSCLVIAGRWYPPYVPGDIKGRWKIYYSDKTRIEGVINMDGYFFDGNTGIMFYRDGTVVNQFDAFVYDHKFESYFDKLKTDPKEKTIFEYGSGNPYWGVFLIKSDTIIVDEINHPTPLDALWMAWEIKYKIIDKNTIRKIDEEPLWTMTPAWEYVEFKKSMAKKHFPDAHFVPAPNRPDSINWLKKERWFWCKGK